MNMPEPDGAQLGADAYDMANELMGLGRWFDARRWWLCARRLGHPGAADALARLDALHAETSGIDAMAVLGDHLLGREP